MLLYVCPIIKNNLIMTRREKTIFFIAVLLSSFCIGLLISLYKQDKVIEDLTKKNERDSLILVSKKFVNDAKVKNDSLMNELVREPWKLDSVSPEVKKEYLRKYKVIE